MRDNVLKIILTPVVKRLYYWYDRSKNAKDKKAVSINENIELIKGINKAYLGPDKNEKLLASKVKFRHIKIVKDSGEFLNEKNKNNIFRHERLV